MTIRAKTTLVAGLVLVVTLAAAIALLRPVEQAQASALDEDTLYIPSAKAISRMTLGYTGLAADIYWTRAVQYFGERHRIHSDRYPLLYPLLNVATDLDPKMLVAYQYGSIFLAQHRPGGAGQPDNAVQLVEKGIRANPEQWKLYLSLGFIHYTERQDPQAAADAFERGSRVPNAHPALKVLAATVLQEGGEAGKAKLLWAAIHDTTTDKDIRRTAFQHLRSIQSDEQVTALEALVERYRAHTGSAPSNFAEMVAAGWLKRVPEDPAGFPYKLTPEGHVEIESLVDLPFVTKGIPAGQTPRSPLKLPGEL
jgi:tetratricopeptide (TPR) repeat protein